MDDVPKANGAVYVLSNAAMEGYIKIGRTDEGTVDSVVQRMHLLNNTNSLPLPFDCEHASAVGDAQAVEKALHEAFGNYRVGDYPVRADRGFFCGLAPFQVVAILKLLEIEDVTPPSGKPDTTECDVPKQPKKPPFRFDAVDIPLGAMLQWRDNPNIECQVVSDTTYVLYKEERWAISTLAKELKGWKYAPAGPEYFLYEGETLRHREQRMEREEAEG